MGFKLTSSDAVVRCESLKNGAAREIECDCQSCKSYRSPQFGYYSKGSEN